MNSLHYTASPGVTFVFPRVCCKAGVGKGLENWLSLANFFSVRSYDELIALHCYVDLASFPGLHHFRLNVQFSDNERK